MKKEKILDGITLVLGLALVILLVVFRKDYDALLYSASILGILLGICFVFKKYNYGYLIVSMAGSLLLSTIFYYQKILIFNECVTFMICSSVALLMFFTTIFDGLIKKGIKAKYSLEVMAKVIDLEQNKNVKKECYAPVYEYEVDGTIYEIVAPYYLDKNIPAIGDELMVRVDPTNAEQVYFDKSISEELKEKFVAIVLMIVCIMIIVGLF
jgi:hypothetical protein